MMTEDDKLVGFYSAQVQSAVRSPSKLSRQDRLREPFNQKGEWAPEEAKKEKKLKRRTSELGPELGQQQQQPPQIATNNRHTVSSYINRWSVDQLNTNRMSQKWGERERERT